MNSSLLAAVGLAGAPASEVRSFAQSAGVPVEVIRFCDTHHKLPAGDELRRVAVQAGISVDALKLRMGILDRWLVERLVEHADAIASLLPNPEDAGPGGAKPVPAFVTDLGTLYQGDCVSVMRHLPSESVDLIFADPPFNLDKLYPSGINDDLRERIYLEWCEQWLDECVRLLKPGGSLFVWNLPRWNAAVGQFLSGRLTFRHLIAADIKYSLPIAGRLYPSHYSLAYFCKGERPRVFHPDRLPMEICPHCYADLRDYGGYKAKMNPAGVNLTDVWYDIHPVRHSKFKNRDGANELPIKLLDRVLQMASDEGDLVLDPFGGAGTTYAVAEIKNRRWLGVEIGPVDDIVTRLQDLSGERKRLERIREGYNRLFTKHSAVERGKRGWWTDKTVRERNGNEEEAVDEEQPKLPLGEI